MGSLQKLAVGIVMLIFSVSWDGTEGRARPIYKLIKLLLCKDLGASASLIMLNILVTEQDTIIL